MNAITRKPALVAGPVSSPMAPARPAVAWPRLARIAETLLPPLVVVAEV